MVHHFSWEIQIWRLNKWDMFCNCRGGKNAALWRPTADSGNQWTTQEKKLVDRAEFLEAMILVLDDVRMQNIRSRDYAMMEIVSEEIPLYQQRLEESNARC